MYDVLPTEKQVGKFGALPGEAKSVSPSTFQRYFDSSDLIAQTNICTNLIC